MATLTEDAEALCSIARKTGKTLMTPCGLNHFHYMESAADQLQCEVLVQSSTSPYKCLLP